MQRSKFVEKRLYGHLSTLYDLPAEMRQRAGQGGASFTTAAKWRRVKNLLPGIERAVRR